VSEILELPGSSLIARQFKEMLEKIVLPTIGRNSLSSIWAELYQHGTHPLIYQVGGNWEVWGNKDNNGNSQLLAHMILVASGCAVVSKEMGIDARDVTLAGMVHDGHKRMDIEVGSDEGHTASYKRLIDLFGAQVAQIAEYSGHTSMHNVVAELAMPGRDWGKLLFFLIDGIAVHDGFQPVSAKCDYLDSVAAEGKKYQYNSDGIKEWGHPFFTFQRYLSETIQAMVAHKLGVFTAD